MDAIGFSQPLATAVQPPAQAPAAAEARPQSLTNPLIDAQAQAGAQTRARDAVQPAAQNDRQGLDQARTRPDPGAVVPRPAAGGADRALPSAFAGGADAAPAPARPPADTGRGQIVDLFV